MEVVRDSSKDCFNGVVGPDNTMVWGEQIMVWGLRFFGHDIGDSLGKWGDLNAGETFVIASFLSLYSNHGSDGVLEAPHWDYPLC